MPLIDRTYFEDELNIPKTDEVPAQESLDALIQKYEPRLLKDILGYELYKAFMTGLAQTPIAAMWTNLLLGAEYTDRFGHLQLWPGLVSELPVLINAVDEGTTTGYTAQSADVASQTIPVPTNMVGRTWTLQKRAIGPLLTDEYDVSDDGTAIAFTTPIVLGDVYFFYCNDLSLQQSSIGSKQSLIANYIYYWYWRENVSKTTVTGEVVASNENSTINGSHIKMQRAWNEMCDLIYQMIDFLDNNRTVYTDWRWQHRYKIIQDYRYIWRS